MFTGIIETIGTVKKIKSRGNYKILTLAPEKEFVDLVMGESIAVDGCCLTLIAFDKKSFTVEASQETVRLTILSKYKIGDKVNLERALQPSGRLGGHFVSGHIDCTGKIEGLNKIGDSLEVVVQFPEEFGVYLVEKGSITINGISLTVNRIVDSTFSVNLIPFTQAETTINKFKKENIVNLEFDILGKYVARFLGKDKKSNVTIDKLIESGW
jgi:riboflavin synthase